jgi:hypothetical protein
LPSLCSSFAPWRSQLEQFARSPRAAMTVRAVKSLGRRASALPASPRLSPCAFSPQPSAPRSPAVK